MLGKLFGSNARVKLLKLFLLHPQKKYYIRQLARELKLQINSVRRELDNLAEMGLLISSMGTSEGENEANVFTEKPIEENQAESARKAKKSAASKASNNQEKKYYQANPEFILFEEIKSLIVKAQIIHKDEFVEKIKRTGKVKLVVLSGIFVNNPKSRTDVLVVGRVDKPKFMRVIRSLENDLGREINFTLMDSREYRYRRDMTDVFLYGILEGNKIIAVDEVGLS